MKTFLSLVLVLAVASCNGSAPQIHVDLSHVSFAKHHIINGTLDATSDPAVVELFYVSNSGNSQSGGSCTGELIGAKSVLTAGHCASTGSVSEVNPDSLPLCTDATCISDVMNGNNSTNLAALMLLNDCSTPSSDPNGCEGASINAGRFIIVDQLTNPGYNPNAQVDNDIGLAHLASTTLAVPSSGTMPTPLPINNSAQNIPAIGSYYSSVRFVGYGITSASSANAGVKYTVTLPSSNNNTKVVVADAYHDQENVSGSGSEPTCSGDSGGPSLYSINGVPTIVAVTSLGDPNCAMYGQDTRVDPYYSWINTTLTAAGWGDTIGSTPPTTSGTTGGSSGSTGGSTSGTFGSCTPSTSVVDNGDIGATCTGAAATGATPVPGSCASGELCQDLFGDGTARCWATCVAPNYACPAQSICLNVGTAALPSLYCLPGCTPSAGTCPSAGLACNPFSPDLNEEGACFPSCATASDCNGTSGTAYVCTSGACLCTQTSDCVGYGPGYLCDPTSGDCYLPCTGTCTDDTGCCATEGSIQYCDLEGVLPATNGSTGSVGTTATNGSGTGTNAASGSGTPSTTGSSGSGTGTNAASGGVSGTGTGPGSGSTTSSSGSAASSTTSSSHGASGSSSSGSGSSGSGSSSGTTFSATKTTSGGCSTGGGGLSFLPLLGLVALRRRRKI